jgi:hypothetical protein
LTTTGVASGWIRLHSLPNKARQWAFQFLMDINASDLLPVLELRSGNDSEFINGAAETWRKEDIPPFSRSRAHKKNGVAARQYLGRDGLEGFEERALAATVCKPPVPPLNFFMSTQKFKSKTRIGSKEIKVYDKPKSLFVRLKEISEVPRPYQRSS